MGAVNVAVSVENLEAGLRRWNELSESGNWPSDLHAGLYVRQAQLRAGGLGEQWWAATVDEFSRWRAIRPLTKANIRDRGRGLLPQLSLAYHDLLRANCNLVDAKWTNLACLFDLAYRVKPTKSQSPVFASKLCHFMFPDLFIVVDRAVVGLRDPYSTYWQTCSDAWRLAKPNHGLLRGKIDAVIGEAVDQSFPYATKITELCIIGASRWVHDR